MVYDSLKFELFSQALHYVTIVRNMNIVCARTPIVSYAHMFILVHTYLILCTYYINIRISTTVEPLFYDHPQNQIGVVVKQGWSSTRGLIIL